jgi:hypothetical protein
MGEIFGAGLTPLLFGIVFGAIVGFIGGAVKQGAFKTTFAWAYSIVCVAICFFATLGMLR